MKKKIGIVILFVIILIGVTLFAISIINTKKEEKLEQEKQELVENIKSHYNKHVKTLKTTKLYKKENNKYVEVGSVNENVDLTLKDTKITHETKYFEIDFLDMYISYEDVEKTKEYKIDKTYENYIYFNKNITTNDITNFYTFEGDLKYTINGSFDFKVLVMDDNRYGIVYNDEL